jgi:amino acid adenylation domain-containing protein
MKKEDTLTPRDYWVQVLDGEPSIVNFPRDFKSAIEYKRGLIDLEIDGQLSQKILGLTKNLDVLIYVVLMSAFKILVHKYTQATDITVGAPVYTEDGNYYGQNKLVLFRNPVDPQFTFKQLLGKVKASVIKGYKNQHYPVENIFSENGIKNGEALTHRVIILFENIHNRESLATIIDSTRNDMTFSFNRDQDRINGNIQYNAAQFSDETMAQIKTYYLKVLETVLTNIDIPVQDIELITPQEEQKIIHDFNSRSTLQPLDTTMHRLFEQQVAHYPQHTALIFENQELNYLHLNQQANRLARKLKECHVTRGTIVAMMMENSIEMVVAILAILKAGGIFLPIDPEYPAGRIDYMIKDSAVDTILIQKRFNEIVPGIPHCIVIDDLDLSTFSDNDLEDIVQNGEDYAYIIYTSGTTGKPKAVLVQHKGIVNYTRWRLQTYEYTPHDVTLQLLTYAFDGFGSNFYSSLLSGGALVLIPALKVVDFDYVAQTIRTRKVTNTSLVPGMYAALLESAQKEDLQSLRFVVLAGEAADPQLLIRSKQKNPNIWLIDEYGPTEASVTAAANIAINENNTNNIGTPIANVALYILDSHHHIQAIGITGQLYIAGLGLAAGYLNRPQLTSEKFRHVFHPPNRSHSSHLSYATGDLARWQPDGTIQFMGRVDQQVKIRGHRVELKEIESWVLSNPHIKTAVVMIRHKHDGASDQSIRESYLCVYYVPNDTEGEEVTHLRDYLMGVLPHYMVPSHLIPMPEMPLTTNGKIDFTALPDPETAGTGAAYEPPRNHIEQKLQDIWSDVLEIEKDKIGINTNFFGLGGHSLQATVLATKVRKELSVQLPISQVFENPKIKILAQYISHQKEDIFTAIQPAPQQESYPLSAAQRRLYILQQMDPYSTGYNTTQVMKITGNLDVPQLQQTFTQLIHRHESLRTAFVMADAKPAQQIHSPQEIQFDIRHYGPESDAHAVVQEFVQPFDLAQPPLLRVGIITQNQDENLLLVDMHHIIADGVSHDILVRDFKALQAGEELVPLRIQYKDFSYWQHSSAVVKTVQEQEKFWLREFQDEIPVLDLPTDFARPITRDFSGSTLSFEIPANVAQPLKDIAQNEGASLFMVLLALFNILLMKLSGQEDIIVGIPTAGRRHDDLQQIIGMFVNTLALRNYPEGDKTFNQFLLELKTRTLEAFEHQEYQFEDLVDKVAVKRDTGRNPLFDVMFTFQATEIDPAQLPQDQSIPNPNRNSKFDMTLFTSQLLDRFSCVLEYSTSLFKEETLQRYMDYFKQVAARVAENPDTRISEIDIISLNEQEQILNQFNQPTADPETTLTLSSQFQDQVERTPDNEAVYFEGIRLTYHQLNCAANRLAHKLRDRGIQADDVVALVAERSLQMIVGIMGILKAGGAYLPIAVDNPAARTQFMIQDSQAKILVTLAHHEERIKKDQAHPLDIEIITIPNPLQEAATPQDSNLPVCNNNRHLAYVIYTSGTTGEPKSIMVEHRNVNNLVTGLKRRVYEDYQEPQKVAIVAPYVFDASVQQFFAVLLQGHCLYIVPDTVRIDGAALLTFYQDNQIQISDGTPTHIRLMQDSGKIPQSDLRLTHLIIGGEALSIEIVRAFYRSFSQDAPIITNVYGPTECTVDATSFRITPENIHDLETIPIGTPLPNQQLFILNKNFGLQPIGIAGEIHITGLSVARGYCNRPKLTTLKFHQEFHKPHMSPQPHPTYATGDLARWMPDGNIQFLGRIDHQVKIRGFRIELEEIEQNLLKFNRQLPLPVQPPDKRCTQCLLSSAYPGVEFDEHGVCNVCRQYDTYKEQGQDYFKTPQHLDTLIKSAAQDNSSQYDCMLLFSGGKDSSYVLYRLVERGLKVLAFTFDNGYISQTAFKNIKRMTQQLGVDSIISDTPVMPNIFVASLDTDHTVCSGCFKALTTISTKIAREKGINMIFTGLSRGQIFDTKLNGFYSQGIFDTDEIEKKLTLFRKGYHAMDDNMSRLLDTQFEDELWNQIHFIDYFRYDPTPVAEIKSYLSEKDIYWSQPGDTGFCSTNCMINDTGIYMHNTCAGYHNYEAPLSWDIRLGAANREELAHEVSVAVDTQQVETILQEIGYTGSLIKHAVVIDRKDNSGDNYLSAYYVADNEIPTPKIRQYLSDQLPYYMVPTHFTRIEEVPMTRNAKVNRKALPEPETKSSESFIAPKSGVEKTMAQIWQEVLGLDQVGINDNFFDLGGNSLKMISLNSHVNQQLQKDIPVVSMYRYSTISSLLQYLDSQKEEQNHQPVDRGQKIDKAKERMKQRTQKRRNKRTE